MAVREPIIRLRLEDKDALVKLGQMKAEALKVGDSMKLLNSIIRENGKVNANQARQLGELAARKRNLSANIRELENDTGGLTAAGMRFRDKMADATLEAIKQSGILGQLGAKSDTLNIKIVNLNKSYKEGDITLKQYNQQNNILQQELNQTTVNITKMEAQLERLNKDFKEGNITAEQFKAGVASVNAETQKAAGAFTKGVTDLKNYALGMVGVVAAVQVVGRVIGDAVNTVLEFDKALSSIRALGGEYAANIDAIAESAKTVGIEFGISAVESLAAAEALAKAGVSATDILGGALPGALTLAAAGQLDVATAAETAAQAMVQFNLSGADVPKIADLLAAGAASATGEVSDFAQALNQSGLVASQAGISIEETVGALTAFAAAGLVGSDAGTSFRTMLLRLQNPSKESADEMQRLGVNAFDAQGNFVGLEALAGQLQTQLKGLTSEQRSAALAQIFGSDAVRAANVLYTQGAEGVAKYTEMVNQSGFAARVAAEQTDNLSGDLNKLNETYKALILSLEDGSGLLASVSRGVTQSLTALIESLNGANEETSSFTSRILGLFTGTTIIQGYEDTRKWWNRIFGSDSQKEIKATAEAIKTVTAATNELPEFEVVGERSTVGSERKKLTERLKELKASRDNLNLSDIAGRKEIDKQIAATQAAITALELKGESTKKQTDNTRKLTEAEKELVDQLINKNSILASLNEREDMPTNDEVLEGFVVRQREEIVDEKPIDDILEEYDAERDAFLALQEAKTVAVQGFAAALRGLAEEGSTMASVLLGIEKAAAIAQIVINLQREIAGYAANPAWSLLPDGGATLKATAISAAKLRAGTSIGVILAQAIKGFEEGGYTSRASSDKKPVGVVHANEYVVPAPVLRNPKYAAMVEELERARRGYGLRSEPGSFEGGGSTNTYVLTKKSTGMVTNPGGLQEIENSVRMSTAPIFVSVSEINQVQGRVARITERSTL
jgi:TP901 family phage tail tape measure protein